MLRVIDDDSRVVPYMFDLRDAPSRDRILRMCVERGLTGHRFIAWTKTAEGVLLLGAAYSDAIPREEKLGKIILGKFERAAKEKYGNLK